MKLAEATWNGTHWVTFAGPVWVTEFRFEVEQSMASDPSWAGGGGIRRTLSGLTGEQLDEIGRLVDQLRGRSQQPELAPATLGLVRAAEGAE